MLEELGARFDLVIEAVSGFGGRLDKLKEEVFGQFAEVGSQIRFLSDQIAQNRSNLAALHSDFGAEMVRLGETIGASRVEFRAQLALAETNLKREIHAQAETIRSGIRDEIGQGGATARSQAQDGAGAAIGREVAHTMRELKREVAVNAEATAKRLAAELKQTSKALAGLGRKFERFDDRITIQVRDQDQRLKKLEGGGRR